MDKLSSVKEKLSKGSGSTSKHNSRAMGPVSAKPYGDFICDEVAEILAMA